ncbi:MAG: transmembrane 220 family protein [Bacteroidota bacterium]
METKTHRIICIILAQLYTVFAVVQFNDPDPLIWVTIYCLTAASMIFNIYKPIPPAMNGALIIGCIVGAILLWPEEYQGLTGKMESRPGVELARESLGLITCGLGLGYLTWRGFRKKAA